MQKWTTQDIEILKNNYTFGNVGYLSGLLNNKFSYSAIKSKARKINIATRSIWTKSELDILKEYYPIKSVSEMCSLLPDRNRKTITQKAHSLGVKNILTYQTHFSKSDINYIVQNYKTMTDKQVAEKLNRSHGSILDKRLSLGLIKEYDKSSYNSLTEYVRKNNLEWKKLSMQNCKFKCVLTNQRFDEIHHIHGLNLILNETISEFNVAIKSSFDEYSYEDLNTILNKFRIVQSKYPLGVCLKKEYHLLFHNTYGYGSNNETQWNEFVTNIKEFNQI